MANSNYIQFLKERVKNGDKQLQQTLLTFQETLTTLKAKGPKQPSWDIDQHIGHDCPAHGNIIYMIWQYWPEYSGLPMFPVPLPGSIPAQAYKTHFEDLWNRKIVYGQKRWALVDFLIETVDQILN